MLIRDSIWDSIREQFSEEEKVELRKHVTGEAICPRGFCVDAESVPQPLQKKLMDAVHNQAVETRRNQRGPKGS
jgi:hypothetical protein